MNHQQDLEELREHYAAALPSKIAAIRADWAHLKRQYQHTLFIDLIRKVHSLVGSGGTFGFSPLSAAAAKLELELRPLEGQVDFLTQTVEHLEYLFIALEHAALQPYDNDIQTDKSYPLKIAGFNNNTDPAILLVSANQAFTEDLSNRLDTYNITCYSASSCSDLAPQIACINPCCIVLELSSNPMADLAVINEIQLGLYTAPALIVISSHHDIAIHLSAIRAGALAYIQPPVKTSELVALLRLHLNPTSEPPYRILIVDDDEQFAHHTALLLQRVGMKVVVLTNPLDILEPLASFHPEVILLDLYMPECSGIELASLIRQQSLYSGIHIVFFSVETDIDRHIEALRVGGNDFFLKPIPPKQLIAKVEAKAKNARALQKLMLHDALTGALNRSHFIETIDQQIAISQRHKSVFSYVILDLDHFKRVNDQFGHLAGDEVLKSFAELAMSRLRAVDSVIRYGGEEFVILLPDTTAEQAKPLMQDLLQKFMALSFKVDNQVFSVSFSAGIVQYPTYADAAGLAEAADKALYQAKAAGRKQVFLAAIRQNEQ